VGGYRDDVDRRMLALLDTADAATLDAVAPLIAIGTHHEQQHQELLLMDIKHVLSRNPLRPVYGGAAAAPQPTTPMGWVAFDGGLVEVGHGGPSMLGADVLDDFAFDNEGPRHRVWLEPYALADRLVTNAEWMAFMADDGYGRHAMAPTAGRGQRRGLARSPGLGRGRRRVARAHLRALAGDPARSATSAHGPEA
jgi:formylglycine-generating enzyme required for sulfatase activity